MNSEQIQKISSSTGTILTGAALLAVPKVHAGESSMIKIALVGCGNRGTGALRQALNADPQTKLWAVADAFTKKAVNMSEAMKSVFPEERIDLPEERIFSGLDGYKKAIDALGPGDVVILATPAAFRPLHFEYAVNKGVHIFAEKPLAVDIPGLKRLRAANEIAKKKNLKIAVGLNNRHFLRTEETIKAIHDGKLGEIISCFVYRCQSHRGLKPIGNLPPLQHQLMNIFSFDWTCGGFIVDGIVHNIDICCWAKNDWPIEAQGIGGRVARKEKDQRLDIVSVEYTFRDGKKMVIQGRSMNNVWQYFQSNIMGTKGCSQVGEGIREPKIFAGFNLNGKDRKVIWEPKSPFYDSYQMEHNRLFEAIRQGKNWNEIDRGIMATFTGIMGRIVYQTGEKLTAERVWNSTYELTPGIDHYTIDGPSPCMPDKDGNYFNPVPGLFKFT